MKVKLIVSLPEKYPEEKPELRLKNMSPEVIGNNKINEFEDLLEEKIQENLGSIMMFDLCETLRE